MVQNPRSGKITKRLVDALTSEGVRFTLWDTQLKGFGVRVAVSDTKTYVVRYRTIGGADRLLHIARHGVVTAEEARERAAAVLAEVASGGDPQGTKVERREELTMSELCDLYMKEGVTMKKATTLRIDRIRIARHIKPRLGKMKVTDIGRADIERLMVDVGSGRIRGEATPHTRGGIHAASRTVGLLGGIFTFAVEREFVKTNPTRGVKRYKDNRRDRFLSPAELARLGDVLAELEKHALSGIGLDVVFSRRLVEADTVEAGGPLAGFTVGAPEAGGFHHAEARALLAGALRRQDGRVCGQVEIGRAHV